MMIQESLAMAVRQLSEVSDTPELEAERLLLTVLGQAEASWLHAHGTDTVTPQDESRLSELVTRRQTGEPLAYLLGEWEFYGRSFIVTPDVLVPRPETEELITRALTYLDQQDKPQTVADLGTGSGCIAITLACERPGKMEQLIATDNSEAALAVARENAKRHGVDDKIRFVQEDISTTLAQDHIDLVVSNPPYVPTQELAAVEHERDTRGLAFEPRQALDGGTDGKRYTRLIEESSLPYFVETINGEIKAGNH